MSLMLQPNHIPFAVESALSGVGRMVGMDNALWYERTFTVPKNWKGKNIILHFGAVDWQSDVWVNGIHLGQHKGGYTPFEYDNSILSSNRFFSQSKFPYVKTVFI